MDFELSEEQQMVRDTARRFCDKEIAPFARDWDRAEEIDQGIVEALAERAFSGRRSPRTSGDRPGHGLLHAWSSRNWAAPTPRSGASSQ